MRRLQMTRLFLSFILLQQTVFGSIIINGNKVQDSAMQYMASVQDVRGHVCGGFLVSDKFVLTAAHCDNNWLIRVVLGNHNIKNHRSGQAIDIHERFKHHSYKKVGTGDDLMLLKLKQRVVLGNNVQIIQLPTASMNVKVHDRCQVAGWGRTTTGGRIVDDLMVVSVSVIGLDTCRSKWKQLPHNVICAGGYNTSSGFCQGDSGGPLVCNNIAVGIVSFNRNSNCNYKEDFPNVYVDISKYLDWILHTISFK